MKTNFKPDTTDERFYPSSVGQNGAKKGSTLINQFIKRALLRKKDGISKSDVNNEFSLEFDAKKNGLTSELTERINHLNRSLEKNKAELEDITEHYDDYVKAELLETPEEKFQEIDELEARGLILEHQISEIEFELSILKSEYYE